MFAYPILLEAMGGNGIVGEMKTAIINISLAVALASAICGYWKTTGILCAIVLILWITSDKPEWS